MSEYESSESDEAAFLLDFLSLRLSFSGSKGFILVLLSSHLRMNLGVMGGIGQVSWDVSVRMCDS